MAPPIVYDNVARVADDDESTLFNGTKFWVHQRVPTRGSIINDITANGGREVKLEKLADVIIADHARKDAPANSVSWKYIVESVKSGQLADIAEYHIGGPAGPARSTVGTSAPVKQTRTSFTDEEDRKLVDWVRKQPYSRGNVCYKDFAEENPRHTWQSYMDRYRKFLINRPDEAPTAAPDPEPIHLRHQTPVPQPPPAKPRSPAAVLSHPSKKRLFTPQEDKILRDYVQKRVAEGQGESGNRIYQELEEMYPHRTFHSWRDRWLRHLSRRVPEEETTASGQPAAPEPPRVSQPPQGLRSPPVPRPSRESRPSRVAEPSRVSPPPRKPQLSRAAQPPLEPPSRNPRAPRQSTHARTPAPPGDRAAQLALRAQQKLRERAASVILRAWQAWRFRRAVRSWLDSNLGQVEIKEESPDSEVGMLPVDEAAVQPETESQAETETRHPAGVEMTNDESHQIPWPTCSAPRRSVKEQFYIDIQRYYEFSGLPLQKWLTVENKTLELWDLWKAVTDQDEESQYRDWEQIAEVLEFNWLDNPNVTNQLQAAFDEHLKGFEEVLKSFEDEMDTSEDEEGEEEGEEEEGQQSPARIPEILESSPSVPATKRRRKHLVSSPVLGVSPPNKRLRYDLDQEIPETPEKAGQAGQTTPRAGRTLPTVEPVSLRTKRQHDLAQRASTKPIPEPETQDFTFGQPPGHGETEPDLLKLQDEEPPLSDDSNGAEFLPLKQLIQNPAKLKNQKKPAPRSGSSSDAFGTPMESPPTRPTRTAPAANPNPKRSQFASSATLKTAPVPVLTNRLSPVIPYSPPRRRPSNVAQPSSATRRPVPEPNPCPPQPSREDRTHRPSGLAPPVPFFNSSPSEPKQQTRPESLANLTQEERDYHIREYMKAGFHKEHVMAALQATNMVTDNAELVMMSLAGGEGIPGNTKGVWTKKDDAEMTAVEELRERARELPQLHLVADEIVERLVKKHGAASVKERRKYLA